MNPTDVFIRRGNLDTQRDIRSTHKHTHGKVHVRTQQEGCHLQAKGERPLEKPNLLTP